MHEAIFLLYCLSPEAASDILHFVRTTPPRYPSAWVIRSVNNVFWELLCEDYRIALGS